MRTIASIILAATLVTTAAVAAETTGPLAPGKPAGVNKAELGTAGWTLIGIGLVGAIALGVATSSNGSPVQQGSNVAVPATTI